MIIYSENISKRLTFVAEFIFSVIGVSFKITDNVNLFNSYKELKLNYSKEPIDGSFHIIPQGLLSETEITLAKPKFVFDFTLPVIYFKSKGDLQFDIFSAVFWFISRYEEYQGYKPDSHGRFPATESLLFKHNLHEQPMVDHWIEYFITKLKQFAPNLQIIQPSFNHLTTIDVDSPWCYKNKGAYRNLGGLMRDTIKLKVKDFTLRLQVLSGLKTDPWYNFEWLHKKQAELGFAIKYFIHVGDYATYDKTVPFNTKAFKKFIEYLSVNNKLALHPSYKAHNNDAKFSEERERLAHLINDEVNESRQHYLVFGLHSYYTMLNDMGITYDYSMGFADKPGFRAGTSRSFVFFDLKQNKQTKLIVHPFVIMDRTLNSYENMTSEKALEYIKPLINQVKETKGTFISLWHNESFSNKFEWRGWRNVFIEMQQHLKS